MKIVRRVISAVMLLVAIFAGALWARSYFIADSVRRGTASNHVHITSAAGRIVLTRATPTDVVVPLEIAPPATQPTVAGDVWRYERGPEPHQFVRAARFGENVWSRIGFGFTRQHIRFPDHMAVTNIATPHWFICLIALPIALRGLAKVHAGDESPTLECPECGQMFTQVPADCPVCGHRFAALSPGAPDA